MGNVGNYGRKLFARNMNAVWRRITTPVISVLLALGISAVVLLLSRNNPLLAYASLIKGALGSGKSIVRTLEKATPLLFSGLAVTLAFKAGLFNIGVQGQLLFGALISAGIGFKFTNLPMIIHIPLALLGGAVVGALYASISGALKSFTGAHEVITTIMLNYVAFNLTDYISGVAWRDTTLGNVLARTPVIADSAVLPNLPGGFPIGFFLAVICAAGIWWFFTYTTLGLEIKTVGLNQHAAKYAGIKVHMIVIISMALSGAIAGIGGAVETQGIIGRFQPGFNAHLGFDGITVALLGRTNPMGNIFAALLIGVMRAGSSQMQFSAGVSPEIIDVIQALILFFIAAPAIVNFIVRRTSGSEENISLTSNWGGE